MAATDVIRTTEQWALEAVEGAAGAPRTTEQWALEAVEGAAGAPRTTEQWVIYVGTRSSDYVNAAEQWVLEAVGGVEGVTPEVHEQWVLLMVDDVVPTTPVGAWTLELDGHLFYGLNLGLQGTAVYDTTTQRWTDWASGSFPWLNMNLTVRWNNEIYGASLIDQSLVKFNPASVLDDDFRTNVFLGAGRMEYQDRAFVAMPEAQVLGSIGLAGGVVKFRYSDDDGASWSSDRSYTVTAGDRAANVVFYDLGSVRAPGRLFEIEDAGTLKRIGALRVKTDG